MKRLLMLSFVSLFLFALIACDELSTTISQETTTAIVTTLSDTNQTTSETPTTISSNQTTAPVTAVTTGAITSVTTEVTTVVTTAPPTSTITEVTTTPTTEPSTTFVTEVTTVPTTEPITTTVPEITTVPTTEAITTTITEVTTVPTTEPLTTTVTEITTVPTTATTTEITTVTEEFVDIADILTDQPTGEVKVRGVVYYAIAGTVQPSYYLYDGTGYILVLDGSEVEVGDGVQFRAEFEIGEFSPQLINVTSFSEYSEKPALPEYVVTGIPDIVAHPDTDYTFYGSPLRITGVVASMGPALMLENGASKVILNNKAFLAGNPFLSLIGQTVTINAVVHFYDDMMSAWHVLYDPAYPVEEEEPIVENPFIPGSGGVLSERTPSVLEPGTFAGLMITKVDREPGAFGGVSNVVEMMFPYPDNFDATSYTLQYFDANDSTWKNYQHNDEDLTTTGDNFSLTMYESMTLRLIINDGPNAGSTSNEQSYVLPVQDCRYSGYSIEYGMNDEGIMVPFVGFTIHASFTAENFSDETIVDVSNTLTYKWYRLDPITYEMILIESATGLIEYDATMADVGYYICVIAEGDGINSDGMYFAMVDWIVLAGNPGFITDASASGFTVNLLYEVSGLDPNIFDIYDQDWNQVQVLSVVQGDSPAIYHVSIDDTTITNNYSFSYNNGYWAMQFDMAPGEEFHHYVEMGYVELVPLE